MQNTRPETAITPAAVTSFIGHVLTVTNGSAVDVLEPATGSRHGVVGHLDGVVALRAGDAVLASTTSTGVVIVGRLRGSDETPAAVLREAGGRLEISAERSVAIHAGRSRIEIGADGVIRVDGEEVHHTAERRLSLMGASLEFN